MSKRFCYRGDDAEAIKRGWQKVYIWPEALHDAYRYDTTKLSAYLHQVAQGNLDALDQDQLEQLAKLLERRIHRNKSGRKKGPIPPRDPDAITPEYVAALARTEVERMKRGRHSRRGSIPAQAGEP